MKNSSLLFIFSLCISFQISGQTLFVKNPKIGINTPIPVQFENSSGLAGSWIGFYRESEPDGNYISFQYINELKNGEVNFPGWKQAGIYNFRLFKDNGYAKIATSNSFLVVQGMIIDSSFGKEGSFHWDASGAGLGNEFKSVRMDKDGRLLFAGGVLNGKTSTNGAPTVDFLVVKLDQNGQLDQSFGQNGKVIIAPKSSYFQLYPTYFKAFTLQNDGKIVLGGDVIITYGDNTLGYEALLVRLNQNGTYDNSFGDKGVVAFSFRHDGEDKAAFSDEVKCLEITPDQKILVGGGSISSAPFAPGRPALRRFLTNGVYDITFGAAGLITPLDSILWRAYIESIIPPSPGGDGSFFAAATSRAHFGLNQQLLYKFNQNGSYNQIFGNGNPVVERRPGIHNETYSNKLLYAPDGNLILYGGSGGYATWLVKRSSSTGEVIPGFGTQGLVFNDHPEKESPGGMFIDQDRINIAYTGEMYQISMTRFNQKAEIDVVFGSPYYDFVDQAGSFINYYVNDVIRQTKDRYILVGHAHHFNPNHFESFAYAFKDNPLVFTNLENTKEPSPFFLLQNYPNPFNEQTVVPLFLKNNSNVFLEIYNMTGLKLASADFKNLETGYHELQLDEKTLQTKLTSGSYVYSVLITNELGNYRTSRILIKN